MANNHTKRKTGFWHLLSGQPSCISSAMENNRHRLLQRGTPIAEASLSQQKALAIFPKFLALASLCCSLYIAWDILFRVRTRRHTTSNTRLKVYHELVLGMSVTDAMASTAWFFATWPIPPEAFPIWGASGTQETCSAQGFFTQLSIATVLYTGCLAIYFFLVIHRGWKETDLRHYKVSIAAHTICSGFALATCIASLALGLFNPIGWDCWIAALPPGCDESWEHQGKSTCTRGDNASLYQWVFFYIPIYITIFSITIIFAIILRKFRKQERIHQLRDQSFHIASQQFTQSKPTESTISAPQHSRWKRLFRNKKHNTTATNTTILRTSAGQQRLRDLQMQSVCYILSFFATWTFPTILRIHELTGDTVYYHFVMLSATFVPSQGLFNALVYLRPQYIQQLRKRQREKERELRLLAQATLRNDNMNDDKQYYGQDDHAAGGAVVTQEESQVSSNATISAVDVEMTKVAIHKETASDGTIQGRHESFIREMSFGISGYLLRSGPDKSKSDAAFITSSQPSNVDSKYDRDNEQNVDSGFSRNALSEGHAINKPDRVGVAQLSTQSEQKPSSGRDLKSSFRAAKSKANGFRKVMQRLGNTIAKGDGGLGGMGIDDEYGLRTSSGVDDDDDDVMVVEPEDAMPTINEEQLAPSSLMMKSASERHPSVSAMPSDDMHERSQSVHFA